VTKPPYVQLALTLSLLIYAERLNVQGGGLEYATHRVIDHAADLRGWSEERRADLYARIVDKAPDGALMRFLDLQAIVTRCVKEHNRTWIDRP
jgi:hypothetical protein